MLFSWKRRRTEPPPSADRFNPLPTSSFDWSAFEDARSWVSIKIWLEPDLVEKIDLLADYRYQSRSEVMRDLLFVALYGHFVYAQLLSERRGVLRDPGHLQSGERVLFDIPSTTAGDEDSHSPSKSAKKIENIRLFLPQVMRLSLKKIASKQDKTLSDASRTIIEEAMFGFAKFA